MNLKIEGEYNLQKAGEYNLKIIAEDENSNINSKNFTLKIQNKKIITKKSEEIPRSETCFAYKHEARGLTPRTHIVRGRTDSHKLSFDHSCTMASYTNNTFKLAFCVGSFFSNSLTVFPSITHR